MDKRLFGVFISDHPVYENSVVLNFMYPEDEEFNKRIFDKCKLEEKMDLFKHIISNGENRTRIETIVREKLILLMYKTSFIHIEEYLENEYKIMKGDISEDIENIDIKLSMNEDHTLVIDEDKSIQIAEGIRSILNIDADIKIKPIRDDNKHLVSWIEYEWNKNKFDYTIHSPVGNLIPDELRNVHKNRISSFLEGLMIKETAESVVVCILLHEFGHAVNINTMLKNDCLDEALHANSTSESFVRTVFNETDIEDFREEGHELHYWLMPDEMFADSFMYKNFYPVYHKLQRIGVIE